MTPRLKNWLLMQQQAGGLPAGYTELEYLESSGTQWLLLPGCYSQNTGFLADIKYNMKKNTPFRQFWAGAGITSDSSFTNGVDVFAPWYYGYNGVSERWWRIRGEYTGAGQIWNKECHIDFNWLNTKILKLTTDEGTITQDVATVSFNYTRDTIAIFAMIDGDNNEVNPRTVPLHIKYLKISDGENVVRDLIPVLDKTGTPCMFDKANGQCIYNSGTGTFGYRIKTSGEAVAPFARRDPYYTAPSGIYARPAGENELEILADTDIDPDAAEQADYTWHPNTGDAYTAYNITPSPEITA